MSRHRCFFLMLAIGVSAGSLQAQEAKGRKYALLVGAGAPELRRLDYVEADVRGLGEVLQQAGFRLVTVMTPTAGEKNARFQPDGRNIRDELAGFLDGKRKNDSVLVVLAGHAIAYQGANEVYFCPRDAQLSKKTSLISLKEIFKGLEECQAGTRLLIVDACREEAAPAEGLERVTRPQALTPPKGVAVVFSSAEGQYSHDSVKLKRGVFFHYLTQAFKGEAADKKGVINAEALKTYLRDQVYDHVWEEAGRKQMPTFKGEWTGALPWVTRSNDPEQRLAEDLRKAQQRIEDLDRLVLEGKRRQAALDIEREKWRVERENAFKDALLLRDSAKLLALELEKAKTEMAAAAKRSADMAAVQELLLARVKVSEKSLEAARKTIATLEADRLSLILQAKTARQAFDDRFAGIPLTGEKVLFLIDMSGSMAMANPDTLDPDKWPFLCDSVAKVMKSIPGLKQYQVMLFSDKVRYPLGTAGKWLDYDAKTPAAVRQAVLLVRPQGETNMYDVFDEAFTQFGKQKLDTIYVFSDGLPNAGPGLPVGAEKWNEQVRSEHLAKHVRNRLKNVWNAPVKDRPPVRINTLGFYYESSDVGSFLWALARENGGAFVGLR